MNSSKVENPFPNCGVQIGQPHEADCEIQQCSVCGARWYTCCCSDHEHEKSVWNGEWPEAPLTCSHCHGPVYTVAVLYETFQVGHLDNSKKVEFLEDPDPEQFGGALCRNCGGDLAELVQF